MTPLHSIIVSRIRERGPMTVAEFMELALYHPEHGYYASAPQRSGRSGDFVTSIDVGSLFGEMIAVQLDEMWQLLQKAGAERFHLVEAGAGNGRLARDVLDAAAAHHPDLFHHLQLTLVERSAHARAAQAEVLAPYSELLVIEATEDFNSEATEVTETLVTQDNSEAREVTENLLFEDNSEAAEITETPVLEDNSEAAEVTEVLVFEDHSEATEITELLDNSEATVVTEAVENRIDVENPTGSLHVRNAMSTRRLGSWDLESGKTLNMSRSRNSPSTQRSRNHAAASNSEAGQPFISAERDSSGTDDDAASIRAFGSVNESKPTEIPTADSPTPKIPSVTSVASELASETKPSVTSAASELASKTKPSVTSVASELASETKSSVTSVASELASKTRASVTSVASELASETKSSVTPVASELASKTRASVTSVASELATTVASKLKTTGSGPARSPAAPRNCSVRSITGALIANELLDALPVHVVAMTPGGLREVFVGERNGTLIEVEGPVSTPEITAHLTRLGASPARGTRIEVGLAAERWIASAAHSLERGFLLLFDYGHEIEALLSPAHAGGTLMAYRRHIARADAFLSDPGVRDLTAHVNLTAVRAAARAAGLVELGTIDQTYFLAALGIVERLDGGSDRRAVARRLAAKTLLLPGGLGSTIKVMAFARGLGRPALRGLSSGRLT